MGESNSILTRFFSQNTLKKIETHYEPSNDMMNYIVRRYSIPVDKDATNGEIISEIYRYVRKSYRNEYFYKNTLLNKLIINAHRVNTTTALTEVPIAKSKADFIMINGKAVVYEIKTELDTFERLKTQLADYYKAFDHVCVVTSEGQLESLKEKLIDSPVGIYVLTSRDTIHRVKEPEEYRTALDSHCIFKVLNKPEYEEIIRQVLGELPNVTPVHYYRACENLICDLSIEQVYPLFLKELKKRNKIILDYKKIPEALHFLMYFSKTKKYDAENLQKFLSARYEGS